MLSQFSVMGLTVSAIFLFLFILDRILSKKFTFISIITLIFFIISIGLTVVIILEDFKLIDIGATKVAGDVQDFYVSNTVYFQIGYGIFFIIIGTINLFTYKIGVVLKILGALYILLGAFFIVNVVLNLQGIYIFGKPESATPASSLITLFR